MTLQEIQALWQTANTSDRILIGLAMKARVSADWMQGLLLAIARENQAAMTLQRMANDQNELCSHFLSSR